MDFVKRIVIIFCLLVGHLYFSHGQQTSMVNLTSGPITGLTINSGATNLPMNVYRGIPYARPPIGALRFKSPMTVENWTQLKNLTETEGPECPQTESNGTSSFNEDCLYINVYTPSPVQSKLPVMVFIHGGGFEEGSSAYSMYGPDYFLQMDVIFVSFNYRLGVFGFLNLGTADVPGNAGLKDQRMALQWVQAEIEKFGGDKSKVTIFGESAGSTSVSFHYISPGSRGLFARAICESGSSLSETTFLQTGYLERAAQFASQLDCLESNGTVSLTCLQSASVDKILSAQKLQLNDTYKIPGNDIVFPATPEAISSDAVLTDTPANMLESLVENTNLTRVPLILGVNQDEGTIKATTNDIVLSALVNKLKYFIPPSILALKSANEIKKNTDSIYLEYFNNIPPNSTNLDGYIKLYGDKIIKVPTANFVRKIANFPNIYIYNFGYSGGFIHPQGLFGIANIPGKVGHGDELNYLFYQADLNQTKTNSTSADMIMLKNMVTMWTNFATNGKPTPDNGTVKWTAISNTSYPYLHIINNTTAMVNEGFYQNEVTFWNGIYTVSFSPKTYCSAVLLLATLIACKILKNILIFLL